MKETLDGTLSETQGAVSDGRSDYRQRWAHFLTMVAAAQSIACLAASAPWFIALFGWELSSSQYHQRTYHKEDGPFRHKIWKYIGFVIWSVGLFLVIQGGNRPRPVAERAINMSALLVTAIGYGIVSISWHEFQHRSRNISAELEGQHRTAFVVRLAFGCLLISAGICATWFWVWFG